MRTVTLYKWVRPEGQTVYHKAPDGVGLFHQWGMDYEEFETGAAAFSTAIVELPDGTIRNVPVEMIQFEQKLRRLTPRTP